MLDDEGVAEVDELAARVIESSDVYEPHVVGGVLHERGQEGLGL